MEGGGGREGGRAETSIAARLQIHGKPPHEGYWQQLNILVEVLNRRERGSKDRERETKRRGWKEIKKGGREGGR